MWNLPNALTIGRLVLVPVFVVLLVQDTTPARWWSLVVFLVASATDQLDGHLARSRNQVTAFGTLADPIADKALTLGAFVMLSVLGEIPWWITIVIAVRELGSRHCAAFSCGARSCRRRWAARSRPFCR